MGLTNKQYLAITMAVLAFLAASSGQMTEFLGPQAAKSVASAASFLNGILAAIMSVIIGQGSIVKDVQAMPGVESIEINKQANPTLAAMAVDPKEDKIVPKAGDSREIQAIATNA